MTSSNRSHRLSHWTWELDTEGYTAHIVVQAESRERAERRALADRELTDILGREVLRMALSETTPREDSSLEFMHWVLV